eukprot:m.65747 g.65747  ORF g.65747 m.65747 type:complete len:331 (+) comp8313_c0_seq2:125-1117(+)
MNGCLWHYFWWFIIKRLFLHCFFLDRFCWFRLWLWFCLVLRFWFWFWFWLGFGQDRWWQWFWLWFWFRIWLSIWCCGRFVVVVVRALLFHVLKRFIYIKLFILWGLVNLLGFLLLWLLRGLLGGVLGVWCLIYRVGRSPGRVVCLLDQVSPANRPQVRRVNLDSTSLDGRVGCPRTTLWNMLHSGCFRHGVQNVLCFCLTRAVAWDSTHHHAAKHDLYRNSAIFRLSFFCGAPLALFFCGTLRSLLSCDLQCCRIPFCFILFKLPAPLFFHTCRFCSNGSILGRLLSTSLFLFKCKSCPFRLSSFPEWERCFPSYQLSISRLATVVSIAE